MLAGALADFFDQYSSLNDQTDYAVAVSGGPDSMALAHALTTLYPDKKIHILSVDHGLRIEAQEEVKQVGGFFASYKNASHHILKWDGNKPDKAIMEAARKARYELMRDYCAQNKIQTLFVAHHRGDQAETFLIRLAKGSGIDGLSSMRALTNQSGIDLARPFLTLSKEDLFTYCQGNNISYSDDPSNENEAYLRPRLRQAKKVLEAEGLTDKRLSVTAKRLSRATEALCFYTDHLLEDVILESNDTATTVDFKAFYAAPAEIGLRVLQNLIEFYRTGYDYGVRMEKLEDLFESLISDPQNFKARTLGGCRMSLKDKHTKLLIEKELK